jgi:glycosyltransferase involved in cell wall biosynthesis
VKIAFVVQRFGSEFVGGAEKYTMSMASGLAADGHDVTVVTSCATSYADWANEYPAGETHLDGVTVHRIPVTAPRDNDRFIPLHLRANDFRDLPLWPWAQDRWSSLIGPDLVDPESVLGPVAEAADVTVLVGYLYSHTLRLTRIATRHGPTIVIPTAHPEGAFHIRRVGEVFQHADRVLCLAEEERDLVAEVYGCRDRTRVVPCPVEPIAAPPDAEIDRVVGSIGAKRDRYAVTVGRVDPAKGSDDVIHLTRQYRRSIDPGFELVVVGPGADDRHVDEAVRLTGFVDEATKNALIAGAGVLVQPSYMESFSLALIEGWLMERPAMVQERSRVLAGHVRRSGGGVAYSDYPSFEAAMSTFLQHADVAAAAGAAGRRYSVEEFAWPSVAERFLAVAEEAVVAHHREQRVPVT